MAEHDILFLIYGTLQEGIITSFTIDNFIQTLHEEIQNQPERNKRRDQQKIRWVDLV